MNMLQIPMIKIYKITPSLRIHVFGTFERFIFYVGSE